MMHPWLNRVSTAINQRLALVSRGPWSPQAERRADSSEPKSVSVGQSPTATRTRAVCGISGWPSGLTASTRRPVRHTPDCGIHLRHHPGRAGARLLSAWSRRRGRKRQQVGEIDCGLRVIAGSQEGFGVGWDHDRAFVHSGRLDFGRGTSIPVQVRAVVTDRQRQPRGREAWSTVSSNCLIVERMTDSATLEWAVPADKLEWAIARVQGSDVATA